MMKIMSAEIKKAPTHRKWPVMTQILTKSDMKSTVLLSAVWRPWLKDTYRGPLVVIESVIRLNEDQEINFGKERPCHSMALQLQTFLHPNFTYYLIRKSKFCLKTKLKNIFDSSSI